MDDVGRYTLRILNSLANTSFGVEEIVQAMSDCAVPDLCDGVIVFLPALSPGELLVVQAGGGSPAVAARALCGLAEYVQQLLHDGVRGLLDREQTERATTERTPDCPCARDLPWDSLVLAPLVMPGHSPGSALFWTNSTRGGFSDSNISTLVGTTAICTPLLLSTALSDHLLFDRDVTEVLGDAVIVVDPEFRIVRWNTAAEKLYGVLAADAIGCALQAIYTTHFDDPEMTTELAWEELQRTGRWSGQVTQRSKAGLTRSVSASVTAIRDGTGQLIGAVAVNRDNSEMMLARARINVAEGLLADALDAAGAMTVVVDSRGIIVAANRWWLDTALSTGARMDLVSVGADYIRPLREASASSSPGAAEALVALERVLGGSSTSEQLTYRCDRPDGPYWYLMEIRRLGNTPGAVITHRDITRNRELEDIVLQGASQDTVTGLGTRRMLEQRIQEASARGTNRLGLLICDVDDFAAVNESLGYSAGDSVLRIVAERILSQGRKTDTMARLGGDQFAVLVLSADEGTLENLAERIRDCVQQPLECEGSQLTLSLSIGTATYDYNKESSRAVDVASELLARADAARIDSKSLGRNRVRSYRPNLRDRTTALLSMRHEFGEALREGALELHYQQIRSLVDDSVVGFEGLTRWPRSPAPSGVPVLTPDTFGAIMSSPLIAGPLAKWSIRTAISAAAQIRGRPGMGTATVAVNVSPQQFQDIDVAALLLAEATAAGLPLPALVVEITETTALTDNARVLSQIDLLHTAGVGVALDDFGTGFSSLAHLHSLPADSVKIDKSFIAGITSDATSQALVRSLIGLAHELELVVVAEGVESKPQRDWLIDMGCDQYQGFYAHRPAPLARCLEV